MMRHLKFIGLFLALMLVPLFVSTYGKNNFNSNIRFVNDTTDRDHYFLNGSWYPLKKQPYREVFCEYPQLATYFFATPYIIFNALHCPPLNTESYRNIFSVFMMLFLFATILLLYALRSSEKYLAFLMLLPASLYYSYNRYDIVPAFLTVLSIMLLLKNRYKLSSFVLGLSVLTKWYPIVLLPILLNFYYSRAKKIGFIILLVFCVTIALGILPTFFYGGIEAFLTPYQFHLIRGPNQESLFALLNLPLGFKPIFFVLQFCIMPLAILNKITSFRNVVNWTSLSILCFILFAKFYSPQWILWILPFLILRARTKTDVFLIIALDLVTYLYFPVGYFVSTGLFMSMVVIKTLLLLCLIISIIYELASIKTPVLNFKLLFDFFKIRRRMDKQQIRIFINTLNYDLGTIHLLVDSQRLKETIPFVCKILSDIRSFKDQVSFANEALKDCLPEQWAEENVCAKIEGFFKGGVSLSDQELKSIKYDLFLDKLCATIHIAIQKLKIKMKSPLQKKLEVYLPILTVVLLLSFIGIKNIITKDWGLRGDFYAGINFEKYLTTGYKKTIDFDNYLSMNNHIPAENFSARWQGYLLIPKEGLYTFSVFVDDGMRLFMDGRLIMDNWYENHEEPVQTIFLTRGPHKLKLEYYNHLYEAGLKLYWTRPNGQKEIVSEKFLRLDKNIK